MPVGVFESVHDAIVAKFDSTTGLGTGTGTVTGGLWYGRVPEGTSYPYARFAQVGPSLPDYWYGSGNLDTWLMQFDFWHTSRSAVTAYAEALTTAFHRVPLTLTTGTFVTGTRRRVMFTVEAERSPDDKDVYRAMVEIEFIVQA